MPGIMEYNVAISEEIFLGTNSIVKFRHGQEKSFVFMN